MIEKEFKLSSWSIKNPTTIYVIIAIIFFAGISAFFSMPRESFPEIKDSKVYISAVYPGNTAEDIEKLLIKPLEDKLKNLSNVSKITSLSQEDYGMITMEFDDKISIESAKQKVKDEIDQETAGEDWPTFNGAKVIPNVIDINISEMMPIMNINISGDYTPQQLKKYGERLKEDIEQIEEIKEVGVRGAEEKEVEVAVDVFKMTAMQVSFIDIENALNRGNVTMSAGNLINEGQRTTIRVIGEVSKPQELERFVVKSENGNPIYLGDISKIKFRPKDKTTYARENGNSVLMLDVKKRAGKNMVAASEKIEKLLKKAQKNNVFPKDLSIKITNDHSSKTIGQVDDLVNNIIMGVILVVVVLMFFLGFRNSLFVGFAIPMSMLMSLMILSAVGYTMNTMILFGLIMGLGMLVDNGIVVVENVYRLMDEEGMERMEAAKKGIGEIAFPIIISTATTVAAFIPLALWPGMMGKFMRYFPITLSAVLGSSLVVAVFFNSVLVSQFMKLEENEASLKQLIISTGIMAVVGLLIVFLGNDKSWIGVLMLISAVIMWINKYVLKPLIDFFQFKFLPILENLYENSVRFCLKGIMPYVLVFITFIVLVITFMGFGNSIKTHRTKVEFFPDNTPNKIFVYIEYPQGTDIEKTNKTMKVIEQIVQNEINNPKYLDGDYNFLVESTIAQVGAGSGNPYTDGNSTAEMPHRGKITASMREFKFRRGASSHELKENITKALKGENLPKALAGIKISVEKDPVGPPTGYPINIELKGKDYDKLISTAKEMVRFLETKNISGIEQLKIDVNKDKKSKIIKINREKAGELGVSAIQIASQLRNAVFGTKAGVYKENGEDYDIYVRFNKDTRMDENAILNQRITFKNMRGQTLAIPVVNLVSMESKNGFNAIKHNGGERVVTIYSALAPGETDASAVVAKIVDEMDSFKGLSKDIHVDYTGQIEKQKEQMKFLMSALLFGLVLIFLILILQFNSISRPTIIMIAILLSLIGVFGGIFIEGSSFVIMMTMMGIISLAGIVVNNGVVLLDYTDLLIERHKIKHQIDEKMFIPKQALNEAIVVSGKARLRPVLLTAITTVLGLVPLALGININFMTLITDFDAHFYIGGDNVVFWGPLAKTVIYGMIVATFLTLILVPCMYYISTQLKMWIWKNRVFKEKVI